MKIPYLKAHGAKNDFLLTWAHEGPAAPLADLARAICDRHTGVGADGWLLVERAGKRQDADGAIRLINSDGSEAEISGNGTRCAAAFLMHHGLSGERVRIGTGAGVKHLRLLERAGRRFIFEMNMGHPEIREEHLNLPLSTGLRDVTVVWVGNPQCAVPVENFDFDWRGMGAEIERHPHFPNRTNVSFYRAVDGHTIEVRFWERGAGETMSSGTGSTGAAAAAIRRGAVNEPVTVVTPAGELKLRGSPDVFLVGPVEIIAEGVFYLGE